MQAKRIRLFLLIIILPLLTTGCWDSLDINKKNVITATILDYKDNEYTFYMEVASVVTGVQQQGGSGQQGGSSGQQGSSSSTNKVAILEGSGDTLAKARAELDAKADYPIYLSAVRTIIATDNLAKKGIEDWMNRIKEIREYRQTMRCVTTPSDPEELLKITTENAPSIGFGIDQMLQNLSDNGQVLHISSEDVLEKLVEEYTSFLIPAVAVEKNNVAFTGYTVFKDDKSIGFIPKADANSIVFMLNPHAFFIYSIPYNEGKATIKVRLSKKDLKPDYKEGKIVFDLDMGFDAEYMYADKVIPFDENMQKELTNSLKEHLLKELADMVIQSQQQFKSDYLEFNEAFRIAYPEEYKNMDWSKEYPKAEVHIKVDVKLESSPSMDYDPPGENKKDEK